VSPSGKRNAGDLCFSVGDYGTGDPSNFAGRFFAEFRVDVFEGSDHVRYVLDLAFETGHIVTSSAVALCVSVLLVL
jgi:hypothetical protein